VPPRQLLPFKQKPVGAGGRHEVDCREILGSQFDACRHQLGALAIAGAEAALLIIVAADKVRIAQLPGILELQLDQAALGAPVAQRLPLLMRELIEFFCFPEWLTVFLFACAHSPSTKIGRV
jgi:hypothetical protein